MAESLASIALKLSILAQGVGAIYGCFHSHLPDIVLSNDVSFALWVHLEVNITCSAMNYVPFVLSLEEVAEVQTFVQYLVARRPPHGLLPAPHVQSLIYM